MISGLTFKSLIHFEFIFMYGVRKWSHFVVVFILGWPKSPFSFFCKRHFSFSPVTLLIWIFEYVGYLPCGIMLIILNSCLDWLLSTGVPTQPWSMVQREISSTKLQKPLLTHSISHYTFSNTAQIFFAFHSCFYLSWNNKAYYAENAAYFLPSLILKWQPQNSPILITFFWVHIDITAVTIVSNKLLNEVKDN